MKGNLRLEPSLPWTTDLVIAIYCFGFARTVDLRGVVSHEGSSQMVIANPFCAFSSYWVRRNVSDHYVSSLIRFGVKEMADSQSPGMAVRIPLRRSQAGFEVHTSELKLVSNQIQLTIKPPTLTKGLDI